jgi:Zn finger protein HypA/HybF involved in hydrogenase expression
MKKFLFKLACKLIGHNEIYLCKTDNNSVYIVAEKSLSTEQRTCVNSIIVGFGNIPSIKKSLVDLATKTKKESGIVQEGELTLEEN